MKRKTWLILSPFIIFIFSILIHSLYKLSPNFFTSVISPVNESIFEHNKMIVTSFFLFAILDYFLYKRRNSLFNYLIATIICIFTITIIFSFVFFIILKTKDNLVLTLLIYFFVIQISLYIYNILAKKIHFKNQLGLILFIILYFILNIFTYNPPLNGLFYDYHTHTYG